MYKDLLLKLGITTVVALLIGIAIGPFIGYWGGIGIGFALQIFGNYIYKDFIASKQQIQIEKALNQRIELLTYNTVQFACPCGANQFNEVVIINDDNIFVCPKCSQTIRLGVQFTPTVITTPLDNEKQLQKLSKINLEEEIP